MRADTALERLVSIGSGPLGVQSPDGTDLPDSLRTLLAAQNGFYAFESALHVFPSDPAPASTVSVQAWNDPGAWRSTYPRVTDGLLFFAEDIFGCQSAIDRHSVRSFDPETGETEQVADDLEGWAEWILADWEAIAGFPIAHAWQQRHGPLPPGVRLIPIQPFVLGGEFALGNLRSLDAVSGMRLRSAWATQIRDLPDGTTIEFTNIR